MSDVTITPVPPGSTRPLALILWSADDVGIRSAARVLASMLAAAPHELDVVEVDLPKALSGRSLLHSLASIAGRRAEAAALASLGWSAVEGQLGGRRPQVVVTMDPAAASAVDAWRGKGLLRAPQVGVLGGLRLDPAWARTAVDRLSVADPSQAEVAVQLGLPEECLVPCGIPVCGGFSSVSPDEKEELRRRFGLPVDRPVVLVVTDGLAPDQLTGALFQLSMVSERAALLFDVARDDEGAELLRRRASLYGVQAQMFGKVEEAGHLWAAADVVVARPHSYVEQRALALRLPLICLPADEEERETGQIWLRRRVGRTVEQLATLAAEVETQIAPAALLESRQTIGEISRRSSTTEIARLVAQVRADADQILAEVRRRSEPAAAPIAEPVTPRGPLETIGAPAAEPQPSRLEDIHAAETEVGRQVLEHQQETDRWMRRAQLATDRGEEDLRVEAERAAQRHQEAMHHALAELARLAERRRGMRPTPSPRTDRAFRKLEVEEALAALKREIDDADR
jgi:UDP-N-acetylglucosamine:LPS N-acetylglucosamine transferase